MRFGMSNKLGPRMFADNEETIFLAQEIHSKKNYSEKTAEVIDSEINSFLEEAKNRAGEIITRYRVQMDKLVKALLEKETVEQDEFKEIMKG